MVIRSDRLPSTALLLCVFCLFHGNLCLALHNEAGGRLPISAAEPPYIMTRGRHMGSFRAGALTVEQTVRTPWGPSPLQPKQLFCERTSFPYETCGLWQNRLKLVAIGNFVFSSRDVATQIAACGFMFIHCGCVVPLQGATLGTSPRVPGAGRAPRGSTSPGAPTSSAPSAPTGRPRRTRPRSTSVSAVRLSSSHLNSY